MFKKVFSILLFVTLAFLSIFTLFRALIEAHRHEYLFACVGYLVAGFAWGLFFGRWRNADIVEAINTLRQLEGDAVTILCDNPDFNGLPNNAILCCGEWTNWVERRFAGDSIYECLKLAINEYERSPNKDIPTPKIKIHRPSGEIVEAIVVKITGPEVILKLLGDPDKRPGFSEGEALVFKDDGRKIFGSLWWSIVEDKMILRECNGLKIQ